MHLVQLPFGGSPTRDRYSHHDYATPGVVFPFSCRVFWIASLFLLSSSHLRIISPASGFLRCLSVLYDGLTVYQYCFPDAICLCLSRARLRPIYHLCTCTFSPQFHQYTSISHWNCAQWANGQAALACGPVAVWVPVGRPRLEMPWVMAPRGKETFDKLENNLHERALSSTGSRDGALCWDVHVRGDCTRALLRTIAGEQRVLTLSQADCTHQVDLIVQLLFPASSIDSIAPQMPSKRLGHRSSASPWVVGTKECSLTLRLHKQPSGARRARLFANAPS